MIKKTDLLNTIRDLENKINKVESELFDMRFPDGRINTSSTYKPCNYYFAPPYSFCPLTYSYIKENKIKTITLLTLNKCSDFKEVNIKKNNRQIYFKIEEPEKTHYLLLDKETQNIMRLSEEIFAGKNEWIKLDIMK